MFEHRREQELRVWAYLLAPRAINSLQDCSLWGARAADAIRQAESLISTLQAYQMDLYNRAQEIACAPWHLELEFRREYSSVRNCVTYIAEVLRVYDVPGIDRQIVQRQTWPGKERHAALKAFDEIVRQHPGAPITRKLERSPWERR